MWLRGGHRLADRQAIGERWIDGQAETEEDGWMDGWVGREAHRQTEIKDGW